MTPLIDNLFSKSQADAIRTLWEDNNSRFLLEREIGKQLFDNEELLEQLPLAQLIFLMSLATFADSSEECYDVAEVVHWGLKKTDIVPMVTEHHGKDLAYRCLISLGFFKQAMIARTNRRGAPSVNFYRHHGISAFHHIGKDHIGRHFIQWECYINEMFVA